MESLLAFLVTARKATTGHWRPGWLQTGPGGTTGELHDEDVGDDEPTFGWTTDGQRGSPAQAESDGNCAT